VLAMSTHALPVPTRNIPSASRSGPVGGSDVRRQSPRPCRRRAGRSCPVPVAERHGLILVERQEAGRQFAVDRATQADYLTRAPERVVRTVRHARGTHRGVATLRRSRVITNGIDISRVGPHRRGA
jgi:hypothetical protein